MPPRILFCGPSGCGKDTAALMLCEITGLQYAGSMSQLIAPRVGELLGITAEEAYERRHEDRELWFRLGNEMREEDQCALVRAGFAGGGNLLTGARNREEVIESAALGLVDLFVWVHREVPTDSTLKYGWHDLPEDRRYWLDNTSDLANLRQEVQVLAYIAGLYTA